MPDEIPTSAHVPNPAMIDLAVLTPGAGGRTPDPNQTTDTANSRTRSGEPLCLPGYEILEEIGRGGMGVVYRARQTALNRIVALKMIRSATGASGAEIARFLAEAEIVAAIRHPNVVQVFASGMSRTATTPPPPVVNPDAQVARESADRTGAYVAQIADPSPDDQPYMALEYIPGGTLARLIREAGAMAPRTAAELVATVASGVQAARDAGIVHRDLKPANILLQIADAKPGTASGSASAPRGVRSEGDGFRHRSARHVGPHRHRGSSRYAKLHGA